LFHDWEQIEIVETYVKFQNQPEAFFQLKAFLATALGLTNIIIIPYDFGIAYV
jgi:hypothetical protein